MADTPLSNEGAALCTSLGTLQMKPDPYTQHNHAAGTEASDEQPKRSLLDLPAELWSKIGKLAIENSPFFRTSSLDEPDFDLIAQEKWQRMLRLHQPAITRTCRALREELLPYFYQQRVIMNEAPFASWEHVHRLGQFLRAIGRDNRRHVTGGQVFSYDDTAGGTEKLEDMIRRKWKVQCEVVVLAEHDAGLIKYGLHFL
ncbi:uncharacterized protein CLAFUR5_12682 [Fulvia fulva]|uniref:F-box domain-containing protein n=1 Tax=Passalora fulva TaxID=5499 RepID=A0A9Q8UVB0_PASFU|nr:uncharacterized protein CLAFUR5_12682 [Fulvia fulva]UJO23814.1 hypothetical protein CLAFUR5_12682 [Fulvia fulva]WPV35975.1 hypothetical protein CLAFUW7_12822 [Fulvia fulva]